jgi:hypothetical protein
LRVGGVGVLVHVQGDGGIGEGLAEEPAHALLWWVLAVFMYEADLVEP